MDYDRGLTLLVKLTRGATWQQDAALLEARLRENLARMRRFGETPTRQSDRAEIIRLYLD